MSISDEQKIAIKDFTKSIIRLREMKIIRSDRFLGDLGEFLASSEYNLVLARSGRQEGHDTEGENDRVQIKFHNFPTRKNIQLGTPSKYDRVLVVIGPESCLHPKESHNVGKYCFYEFTSQHVAEHFNTGKAHSCDKSGLGVPDKILDLN